MTVCGKCNGRGTVGYFHIDHFVDIECDRCHGSGEVQMTNEDRLKQCDTEQLAEELLAWWFDGANTYSQFGLYKWEIDEAKERIVKWLKEKHHD